ncbi:putative gntR-family transcriptional regulator [Nostocoides japonicum T1-X7]|uniref:Putative gntR-family transcriptional regulator n=1 Tax=Nostocoides japonicum T1-X7 TaxID=1194083 RepID=A0A077M878_9MICO|nr:GntR family transcriptional regulator [Tetrasphaera japonica]CCH80220.1 putative gntR-family transcriptional regulator [Tetrasphaera japonica T1-X7]
MGRWSGPRTTTPDDVYQVVRVAILEGTIGAGEQLREAQIASELGISRASVREALARLAEDGLVVKVPYRGAFVMEIEDREIAEIASVRRLVEAYAMELSGPALRGPHRQDLIDAVAELHRAAATNDVAASIEGHLVFHRLVYDLSGHRLLSDLWHGWEAKLRLYLVADHRTYTDLSEIAHEHEIIAQSLLAADREALRVHVATHFTEALRATGTSPSDS